MGVDPLLVAVLAAARLVPLAALVAWARGASWIVLTGFAALGWALTALQAMRARVLGERARARAANDAAAAIARRAPSSLRGAAHDAVLVRIWRGFLAKTTLATEVEPTLIAMAIALPCAFALAALAAGIVLPMVAVFASVLAIAVRIPLSRRHRALLEPLDAALTRLARDLGTGMRALDDLHAHGLERAFAARVAKDAALLQEAEGRLAVAGAITTWTPALVAGLAILAWLAPHLQDVEHGRSLVLFRAATLLSFAPIGLASMRALIRRTQNRLDARALDELVAMPPDLAPPGDAPVPAELAPLALEGVRFRPLSPFGGNIESRDVFRDANLRWGAEKPLALVGPNGSGKTSLIALLLRLADPNEGRVTVAGVDMRTIDAGPFRARIAYVPQRPLVLEGMTVREAMQLVAPDADERALLAALAELDLEPRLRERGDPLDVPCATLSVGEAQRVAVARALARDADLLVLDEPEAGLDEDARRRVREALERRVARGKKVIVAAQHRDVFPEGATVLELPISAGDLVSVP